MAAFQPTFGNAVQDYFVGRFREVYEERRQRLAQLKTREDALAYVAAVREKIRGVFPLPAEKTPLNPVCTGTLHREGFRIEKTIFYSRPDFPVTANFYIPDRPTGAGVVFLCGHSASGKAYVNYQTGCQGLAMQGYVVLAIDPVGQGERYQFLNEKNTNSVSSYSTREHNMIGKQLLLTGDYFGAWRAWDAIRAMDLLLERPEVDPANIGMTGCSGGGTMTTFVNALEDRLTMAAASCYVTSWRRNIENEIPADIEQIPPDISALGCEMGDFIIARAPRPFMIMAQENDFFDTRGARETYEDAKRVYELLGAGDNIRIGVGPLSHGFSIHHREFVYEFFNHASGLGGAWREPEIEPVPEKDLHCLPVGQVEYLSGRRMVRDFIRDEADRLAAERPKHTSGELKKFLAGRLCAGETKVPYYRILRIQFTDEDSPRKRVFSRFALEIEPKIPAVMKLMSDTDYYHLPGDEKAFLYIPHLDSVDELREMNFAEDARIFGLDVRGIGDTMPTGCDQHGDRYFFAPYTHDYHYAACHMMLGDSYLGAKVRDILGAMALLKDRGYREIHIVGRGQGAIPAALAALLGDEKGKVTLINAPESWDSMLRDAVTMWPQSCMLRGILKETDLPEIYAALPNLKMFHLWNNMLQNKALEF